MKPNLRTILLAVVILIGLLTIGLGIILAQTETPSPTPDPNIPTPTVRPVDLACDLDTLRQEQKTLANQLTTFDPDSESNPGLALDNLFKVGAAYQELALKCGYIPADAATRTVGTDVERILKTLVDINGDPINGQVLYNGDLGCSGCHEGDNRVAPAIEGTYTRIEETRLNDPALAGYTPEQFIVESIVNPAHYVAPGFPGIMPTNFGDRLSAQDLADLLLFLESQDQLLPVDNPTHMVFSGTLTADALISQQTFDGSVGDVITVKLASGNFDPILSILSADGTVLANNDDFGGTKNARIGALLLPASGTYTLQVDSYDHQSTGAYTLDIAAYTGCGPAPVGIVSTTTQSVNLHANPNLNSALTGSVHNDECFSIIGRAANNDWLQVATPTGQSGWIAASLVEVAGDLASIPVVSN